MLATFRHAARLLAKSPGTTLAAVASLALGIGANTTIFTLLDAVVLRPLPVWRADRLVMVTDEAYDTVAYPVFRELADSTRTLRGLAAFAPREGSITVGGTSTIGRLHVVSGNYFDVLGIGAVEGRVLGPSDDRPGGEPIVVLAHAFWRQRFGGDPAAIGRTVLINGSPFTVVGVAPQRFKGAMVGSNPSGWIPISAWPHMATGNYLKLDLFSRNWGWLRMIGRLQDGAEPLQVRAELRELAARAGVEFAGTPEAFDPNVTPLRAAATGLRTRADLQRFVVLLAGVVLAVFGVACANVSGLLLARALTRRREVAVRLALGARRGRIVRELLVESACLASLGACAGLLVAMWTIDLLQKLQLPGEIQMASVDVRVGGLAVAVTAAIALLAVFLFGLAPALHVTRADIVGGLKDRPAGGQASRQLLRGALIAVQVAFSLVLLVGALLFARTLQTTLTSDLGFDPRHLAYAATNVALQRYSPERAVVFCRDVLAQVRSTPGVVTAAWTRLIPSGDRDNETVDVPGYVPPDGRRPSVGVNVVSPGYFETMGIPIVRGRGFTDADTPNAAVAVVVNRTAASRFWEGDALGRTFSIFNTEVTIVGIARDVPPQPGKEPGPFVYGNVMQLPSAAVGQLYLVARAERDAAAMPPALVSAVRAFDRSVPVIEARTMEEQLLDLLGPQRSAAMLLGLLSVIAAVLSAGGIYAMVAFWVTQRTREFGVRLALGADAATIRALALRHAATAVGVGIVAGLPLAIALGRISSGMFYGLSPLDPISFAAAIVVLMTTALLASFIPAQRAASTNPLEALRVDG
jgi:predicted permease